MIFTPQKNNIQKENMNFHTPLVQFQQDNMNKIRALKKELMSTPETKYLDIQKQQQSQ